MLQEHQINLKALVEVRKQIAKEHENEASHAYELVIDAVVDTINDLQKCIDDAHIQYQRYERIINDLEHQIRVKNVEYDEIAQDKVIFRKMAEYLIDNQ